jgi:hypothetical protein
MPPGKASSHYSRRTFLKTTTAALSYAAVLPKGGGAAASSSPPQPAESFIPSGVLAERLEWTRLRLLKGRQPAYTDEFIVADVALKPPRRFNEFSGDLSGRFLGAVAVYPTDGAGERLKILAGKIMARQRGDGRFGNPDLIFTAEQMGTEHMALLWGNGRLLVGLLEYYQAFRDEKALKSALRLGTFLCQVCEQAADPKLRERLTGAGANGFICFTQISEGLVLLARAADDQKYLKVADSIVPLLGPRGIQHSHGYLTTLRGVALLQHDTKNPGTLNYLERVFSDLIHSSDYTTFGSVQEYFGLNNPSRDEKELKTIIANSGADPRDEGCSHADLVRLGLQLWQLTGKVEYLEAAERCLYNGLLANQYPNGDFGSRSFFSRGLKPTDNIDRAWWCCTLHGYRAMPDVFQSVMTSNSRGVQVNLFEPGEWRRNGLHLRLQAGGLASTTPNALLFNIRVMAGTMAAGQLSLRQPSWAGPFQVKINQQTATLIDEKGYLRVAQSLKIQDIIEIVIPFKIRLLYRDGALAGLNEVRPGQFEAALFVGPWLMSLDSHHEPEYFGEPWPGNLLIFPKQPVISVEGKSQTQPLLRLRYLHDGYFDSGEVTLRPAAEMARQDQAILTVWHQFRMEG